MEAALSSLGFARPLWQAHIVQLLQANEAAGNALVFIPYSRSTGEMAGALRQYITGYAERHAASKGAGEARREAEELLRATLTVVSFGNVERNWPRRPRVCARVGGERAQGGGD